MAKAEVEKAQTLLKEKGYYSGKVDGDFGPASLSALHKALGYTPPEHLAEKTVTVPKGAELTPASSFSGFPHLDAESAKRAAKLHPKLRDFIREVSKRVNISLLDSTRGKAAQEKAFNAGNSKAHFGDSAHNYEPAIAMDIVPRPLNWNDRKAFMAVQHIAGWYDPKTGKGAGLALEMKIPIRWGGDWNMDGNPADGWDLPHYELHPWRQFAKESKLYQG